jgi:hypothetical protein
MDVMEMLRWLNDEEKQRFVALEHLFESDGWRLYIKPQLAASIERFKEAGANARTWEENQQALGARLFAEELHNLEQGFFNTLANAAQERREAVAAEDEEEFE